MLYLRALVDIFLTVINFFKKLEGGFFYFSDASSSQGLPTGTKNA
jgi:hypothetical protein